MGRGALIGGEKRERPEGERAPSGNVRFENLIFLAAAGGILDQRQATSQVSSSDFYKGSEENQCSIIPEMDRTICLSISDGEFYGIHEV